jgi:hypothetical protein
VSDTHDRPRLGGLLGIAAVNGRRREAALGSVWNVREPRPTKIWTEQHPWCSKTASSLDGPPDERELVSTVSQA